jgi:hypothetical protein
MPIETRFFKRLVLGLQPTAPDRTMRLAVELAEMLQLELLGLFLEDTSLRDLAKIPFAREFRPLGGGWQSFDLDRLAHDLDMAARNLEHLFTQAAKGLPTRSQFEVVRGPMADTLASISRSGDIVMIMEPVSAAERATEQFVWLSRAAFSSAAAVLLVPPQIARIAGPIVAVAAGPDDPSIEAATAVAAAAREDLVIIESDHHDPDDPRLRQLAADTGLTIKHIAGGRALADPAARAHLFHALHERLVVIKRGAFDDTVASMIASSRRVPVLVVEPPERKRQ